MENRILGYIRGNANLRQWLISQIKATDHEDTLAKLANIIGLEGTLEVIGDEVYQVRCYHTQYDIPLFRHQQKFVEELPGYEPFNGPRLAKKVKKPVLKKSGRKKVN